MINDSVRLSHFNVIIYYFFETIQWHQSKHIEQDGKRHPIPESIFYCHNNYLHITSAYLPKSYHYVCPN